MVSAALVAQEPTGPSRTSVGTYNQEQSRSLFRGCDRNGDDRIDILEAIAVIENMTGRDVYRRVDRDRDGYLDWPEFDQFYRTVVLGGGTLRLQLAQATATRATSTQRETAPRLPGQQTIAAFDQNHNAALDAAEFEALLREFKLPPQAAQQLRTLDRNKDGRIDEAEVQPVLSQLQLAAVFLPRAPRKPNESPLPAPWNEVDSDGDGKISLDEFEAALRLIDPALARWATTIAKAADTNGDGSLNAAELAKVDETRKPAAKSVVPPATPR